MLGCQPDHWSDTAHPRNRKIRKIGSAMLNTMSLRDAAIRLAAVEPRRSTGKLATSVLLSALQTGQLTAGFYFADRWVDIPATHWKEVSSSKFKDSIVVSRKRRLNGSCT